MLKSYFHKHSLEAGLDEAGRGCFAGPVFAAAVILPKNFKSYILNDSKQLNKEQREKMRKLIQKKAIAWAVAKIDNVEIDSINILKASFKAMHAAIDQLSVLPESLLVDGNRFVPYKDLPHQCIIQGDGQYASIAAASVLAKTYRDDYMIALHKEFPHYGWDHNKGYGTPFHRKMLFEYGVTNYHRRSFDLFGDKGQPSLFSELAISNNE